MQCLLFSVVPSVQFQCEFIHILVYFFPLVFANTALQNGFLSIHLPSLYIPSLRDPEKEEGDLKKQNMGM